MLTVPNFDQQFILQTDASGSKLWAILTQKGHPIAYFSKYLPPKLQRELAYYREIFTISGAIQKWCQYLLGRRFVVETDHQSLKALHN